MSKPKNHIPGLREKLQAYANENMLDLAQYSPYHMRLMDGGYTVIDVWTTGRYYIVTTDYLKLTDGNVIERAGEKGDLPLSYLTRFLDTLFYPGEANL